MVDKMIKFSDIEIEWDKLSPLKILFFRAWTYWQHISIFRIFSGEKKYKYFIGYSYDNYKVKELHIVLCKTSAYVKISDGQTKWM